MSKVKIGKKSQEERIAIGDDELIGADEVDEEWIGTTAPPKTPLAKDDSKSLKITNINADYFVLSTDFAPEHALLEEDDELANLLKKNNEIEQSENPIILNIARPYPKKIEICDYHSSPNAVISSKVVSVLCSFKTIYGIQLLPCSIADNDGNIYENYFLMHIYNNIDCIDYKRSELDIRKKTKSKSIKKLRLNNVALNKINITERMIFRPEGAEHLKIFHKSIVEAIEKTEIVGLKFYNIKEYYDGIQFDSFFKK